MRDNCHAEVYYDSENGGVHSDICPHDHDFDKITPEYRKLLHACLDEWLDRSSGTGAFYIKGGRNMFPVDKGEEDEAAD
jgi:hypothetical protein